MENDKPEIEPEDEIFLSTSQACKLWDVTRQTLGNWSEEGLPKSKRGKFPLFSCNEWVRKYKTGDEQSSLIEERKRKLAAEAKLKELELLVKEGKLISKEEVIAEFLKRVNIVTSGLNAITKRFQDRDFITDLKNEINKLRDEYSRKGGILK